MQGEPASTPTSYKLVEYDNTIYEIPIRYIDQENVLLLSDIQALLPNATALLTSSKLIPFKLHPDHHTELIPKRISIPDINGNSVIWQAHVPEENVSTLMEMQRKIDQLGEKMDRLYMSLVQSSSDSSDDDVSVVGASNAHTNTLAIDNHHNEDSNQHEDQNESTRIDDTLDTTRGHMSRSNSPPPAFSTPSHLSVAANGVGASSSASSSSSAIHQRQQQQQQQQQHEAPPSYETSVLSTIKALNAKLRLYESHISNRHKSPKWLAKRDEWISREPDSIEQIAFQLVQLEMALLWTAVTESWIQERETWLTLVASSQSERHLAGAIINLERHTLVMDDEWQQIRERWVNDLLEMVVLPLSHG
ncbi:Bud site selection protein 6 [Mucor velutinosus]|uniref:Bud site selection protein 6 n=1 Tax=Mucor velutinosus TaxID=708070 RepID=A0AAN7DDD4_9FUNG|nr:Bud site selection protein 6 [Mucor velutinosus]